MPAQLVAGIGVSTYGLSRLRRPMKACGINKLYGGLVISTISGEAIRAQECRRCAGRCAAGKSRDKNDFGTEALAIRLH